MAITKIFNFLQKNWSLKMTNCKFIIRNLSPKKKNSMKNWLEK